MILRQLDGVIISSLTNPTQLASDFSSFDPAILSMANVRLLHPTETGHELLHSELERHARENPSRNALEYLNNDGTVAVWTFEKFNQAANQVAHYLISLGLKRDEAVPLCLGKSPIFYICVLGLLKAGCAFTPIDPNLPSQRKIFMIEELGAKVVLTDLATAKNLLLPAQVKAIDIEDALRAKFQPITNPEVLDLSPGCLAYRLYTSGKLTALSTGFRRDFLLTIFLRLYGKTKSGFFRNKERDSHNEVSKDFDSVEGRFEAVTICRDDF